MVFHSECYSKVEEEALRDLQELEQLIPYIPNRKEDAQFQSHLFELLDQLQNLCPRSPHSSLIRKLVARFGDAYFYFGRTGDLCFLTDFMQEAKLAELQFCR